MFKIFESAKRSCIFSGVLVCHVDRWILQPIRSFDFLLFPTRHSTRRLPRATTSPACLFERIL